jgi:post-segregation antitoxin (ccd killing protein)
MGAPKRRMQSENKTDLCVGITVSLKMSTVQELTETAKKRGVTRSALATVLIEDGLQRLKATGK